MLNPHHLKSPFTTPWISAPNQSNFIQVQACSVGREADRTARTCSVQLRSSEGVVLQFKWEERRWKRSMTVKWMVTTRSVIAVAFFPVDKWCRDLSRLSTTVIISKQTFHPFLCLVILFTFFQQGSSTLSVSFHPLRCLL